VSNLHDNNIAHSFGWLVYSDLKIESGSLILAAQDQALNTKYYKMHSSLVVAINLALMGHDHAHSTSNRDI